MVFEKVGISHAPASGNWDALPHICSPDSTGSPILKSQMTSVGHRRKVQL